MGPDIPPFLGNGMKHLGNAMPHLITDKNTDKKDGQQNSHQGKNKIQKIDVGYVPLMGDEEKSPVHNIFKQNRSQSAGYPGD
jgi:hypothetical protein